MFYIGLVIIVLISSAIVLFMIVLAIDTFSFLKDIDEWADGMDKYYGNKEWRKRTAWF